nr:MAG TPA: hypothetical protein [Caudoviricetes sp.]
MYSSRENLVSTRKTNICKLCKPIIYIRIKIDK